MLEKKKNVSLLYKYMLLGFKEHRLVAPSYHNDCHLKAGSRFTVWNIIKISVKVVKTNRKWWPKFENDKISVNIAGIQNYLQIKWILISVFMKVQFLNLKYIKESVNYISLPRSYLFFIFFRFDRFSFFLNLSVILKGWFPEYVIKLPLNGLWTGKYEWKPSLLWTIISK